MKKSGFTLIELLAVIVILAIIALIATPIILNIIQDVRKESSKTSAQNYLKAVELAIITKKLNNGNTSVEDGLYIIQSDGGLCLEGISCTEEKKLKVGVEGKYPSGGTVAIENEKVVKALSTDLSKETVIKIYNYSLKFNENNELEIYDNDLNSNIKNNFVSYNPITIVSNSNYEYLNGYMYNANGLIKISSAAAAAVRYAINDYIPVIEGYTYQIQDNVHVEVWGYDENKTNGVKLYASTYCSSVNMTITIPEGIKYMGLYLMTGSTCKKTEAEVYRLTYTEEELEKNGNNFLQGKRVINFGDSIYSLPYDFNISYYLEKNTSANVFNASFGGTKMSTHLTTGETPYSPFSMFRLADAISSGDWTEQKSNVSEVDSSYVSNYTEKTNYLSTLNFSEVDIITISHGTNDFSGGSSLRNENNKYDIKTYEGALRYSIEKIKESYPNIEIILVTPIYRCDEVTRSDGLELLDFVNSMKTIGEEYKLYVIDNYTDVINSDNCSTYLSDGVHTNYSGSKKIAENISYKLYEKYGN